VPHRDNPKVIVCYRLRLVEHGDPTSRHGLLRQLVSLITMNMANDEKAMMASGGAPPKFPKDPSSFTFITQAVWNELCMWHRPDIGKEIRNCPAELLNNICARESPFRPNFAFSPLENLDTARRMGAHPDYCSRDRFFRQDKWGQYGHTFGEDGINTWQIAPHSLDPRTLATTWMANRGPDARLFTREMMEYGKMHDITDPDELRRIFNMTCNTSSQLQEAHDMNNLAKRVKSEIGDLRSKYRAEIQGPKAFADDDDDMKPEFYFELLKLRLDHMLLFGEIISPTGDCPPAMQAIAQAMEQYLMRNGGQMCVPMESGYSNISRFQDQRAMEAVTMDQIMTVSTCHADALLYIYSALHVYARVAMNCHHLLLGPPGVGKSFALIILTQLLIAETWRMFTYVTAKALAAPGKTNACLIMIFEDAPSSTFGASGGSGGSGGGKKNATSDQENLMKQFMTSTDMSVQSITMEPKRAAELIRCETSCIILAAMNDPSDMFPAPVLDRFCVTVSAQEESENPDDKYSHMDMSMMAKTQRVGDPAIKAASEVLKAHWARRQMLCAYIFHLESCGILDHIDTSCADAFYSQVARAAKRRHINMERARPLTRFRMVVRTLVVLNAIDLLWDSPESPLVGIPFSMDHFLLVNKYLVASVQMAVFAMGLLARQWQDGARSAIVSTMRRHWFPKAKQRIADYNNLKPLRKDGSDPLLDEVLRDAPPAPEGYNPFNFRKPGSAKPGTRAPAKDANVRAYEDEMALFDGLRDEKKFWMYDSCVIGGPCLSAMPQSGKSAPTTDDVVQFLADKLHPLLPKKYLLLEVRGKIKSMLSDTVQVRRRKVPLLGNDDEEDEDFLDWHVQDCAQLMIDNGTIRLAMPTLEHADDGSDVIFGCVQEVINIIYAMSQPQPGKPPRPGYSSLTHASFLYGETEQRKGSRFVWRMIHVDKKKVAEMDREVACRIYNPSFAEDAVQTATQILLKAQDPDYYDPRAMNRLFSAVNPYTVYDVNMDELAAARRAKLLGLSAEDQHYYGPSNDCTRHDAFMRVHYRQMKGPALMHYPECFETRDQKAFHDKWDKKFAANPASFQASTQLDAMVAEQRNRPSLYDRPLRPGGAPLIVPSVHQDTLASREANDRRLRGQAPMEMSQSQRAAPAAAAAAIGDADMDYDFDAVRENQENEDMFQAEMLAVGGDYDDM